jgi:peptidoglycan/LPS O-acetylase OafA/YrhL
MTGPAPRLDSLQMLRGVAACMVMLYHSGSLFAVHTGQLLWNNIFRAGFSGVEVFFVLSGAVIYWVHGSDIGQAGRARNFLVRRGFRLFPVYWAVMLVKVLKDPASVTGATFFTALLLLPAAPPFINVSWTLTYELLFYAAFLLWIVVPVSRVSVFAWPMWILLALAVLPAPDVGAASYAKVWLDFLFNPHLAVFVFGVVVAWTLRRHGPVSPPIASAMVGLGLVAFVTAAVAGTWLSNAAGASLASTAYDIAERQSNWVFDIGVVVFGVPAACVVMGLLSLELRGRFRIPAAGILVWLGDVSYSLYLTHAFVIHLVLSRSEFRAALVSHPVWIVAVWLLAIGIAWLLYRCVEVPAMALGRRFGKSAKPLSRPA